MTQEEFQNRVKMEVTSAEFECINVVYMASDVDKDEFCRAWAKLNAKRIKIFRMSLTEQKKEERLRDSLWKMINKYGWRDYTWKKQHECDETLTVTEVKILSHAGIQLYQFGVAKTMATIIWQVRQYLKVA